MMKGLKGMITRSEVLRELRNIVDEYGEEYRAHCQYLGEDGEPKCIVGVYLARQGVSVQTLDMLGPVSAPNFEDVVGLEFEGEARTTLDVAQRIQDSGYVWGVAVATTARFEYPSNASITCRDVSYLQGYAACLKDVRA